MIVGASYCVYRQSAIDAKQMASLPAMVALAKIGQLPTTMHSGRFALTFPSGHVDYMRLSASKTPDPAIQESFLMRHKVIEYNRATSAYVKGFG